MNAPSEKFDMLRSGLEGVTPGPWTWGQKYVCRRDGDKYIRLFNTPDDEQALEGSQWGIDAAHVARCDPDNIRALLDALASSQEEMERLKRALEPLAAHCAELDALGHADDSTCVWRFKASDIRAAARALASKAGAA